MKIYIITRASTMQLQAIGRAFLAFFYIVIVHLSEDYFNNHDC